MVFHVVDIQVHFFQQRVAESPLSTCYDLQRDLVPQKSAQVQTGREQLHYDEF